MSARRPRPWYLAVVALGVFLRLPALRLGFYVDDYLHQLALHGDLPLRPWSLFDFGTADEWRHVEGVGTFPWWTSPDWKVRFFRPLASLSMGLDHALYGARPAGYHATSLALFAALLFAAHGLYRALGLSRRAALGALALLAASHVSALPAAWIANRNSLLAVLFTVLAVAAIARHETWGRARAGAAALAACVLAALSKESGVAAFLLVALWLALERRRTDEPGLRRWAARSALAALGLGAVYTAALAAAGFGTRSLFYATPRSEPARYAANLARLATAGLLALVTPFVSDRLTFDPSTTRPAVVAALVVVVPLALWMGRALRGAPAAGFLALWIAITLLPQGAAPISDRLLLGPSIASSALLALLFADAFRAGRARLVPARLAGGLVVLSAGVLSALLVPVMIGLLARLSHDERETVLTADVGPRALGRREVFVMQVGDPVVAFTIHTLWGFLSDDRDLRFHVLQIGRRGFAWTREDARTFVLESTGRPFLVEPFERVYLSRPPEPGLTPADGRPFSVEALEPEGGGVRRLRLRFDDPPDARCRFLVDRGGRLVAIEPPAVGATIAIEAAAHAPFTP
jgi:hypothetical protein